MIDVLMVFSVGILFMAIDCIVAGHSCVVVRLVGNARPQLGMDNAILSHDICSR